MGLLDVILGIFGGGGGGGGKVNFGNVNPDDIESYWVVDHEIDQAERAGEAELAAAFARWGLKNMDHWEQVKGALYQRHGQNPDFSMAAGRVQHRIQMASVAESYQMPPEYSSPVHGVDLNRYAAIKARLQLGQAPAQVLPEYQLDPARWHEVDQTWGWRMGPQGDAFAGQILAGSYHAMYQQALAAYGRR
ncbi:MAG: hypothetical protein H6708_34040 [Kofleriaceae bacterium]|nr:hypothetical protein [Myxococcales bacterium]MCB9565436.1 hypothetical protein [Kofleriaceae bacterium]